MEKWYDDLPILDRNKLSKFKFTNDIIVKELEVNEIVLAKATFNKYLFYFLLILDIGIFIGSIKTYKENNNQTGFFFFLFLGIAFFLLIYIISLLQTFLLITNERLIGSLVDVNSNNQWSIVKLIIPLRNIDNLVYDSGSQLKVISKSNGYSIFTNTDDIELVKKTYYAYTQFKEKSETMGADLNSKVNAPSVVSNVNKYDEIEKLSELLGKGIVTQEEFDKKKRDLLGL
jgi:hypothetical protein